MMSPKNCTRKISMSSDNRNRAPTPAELQEAFARMGTEIFETMFGPSDFHIIGTIRDWDVFDRLAEIALPTLVVAGRFDEDK